MTRSNNQSSPSHRLRRIYENNRSVLLNYVDLFNSN